MSYKITNNQFIWVKYTEAHTADAVRDFIHDIITNYSIEERNHILVDARDGEVSDNVLAIGGIMKDFDKFGVHKDARIAVVRTPGRGKYHEYMKNLVTEEGYNFQLFDDFESAVIWLNEK